MELRQLRTFLTVARLSSFNQAASVLNYAQSTVSEQIRVLEQDLDVRLFVRAGKQILLTEAGERLLKYAQRMVDLEEEVKTEVQAQGESHGSLSLRVPETVSIHLLPSVLAAFHQRFPKVRVNIDDCTYTGLQQELQIGMTHLAFLLIPGSLRIPNLNVENLRKLPLAIVSHPEHPLTAHRHVGFQDLKDELVLLSRTDCSYRTMFEQHLVKEQIDAAVIFNFNTTEAIKQCIMGGHGVTIMPEIAVQQEVTAGRLVTIPWKGKQIYVNLFMIWPKNTWISPILQAFMDLVRDNVIA
jgi:DNA-binding transcriptional LysR family regulator